MLHLLHSEVPVLSEISDFLSRIASGHSVVFRVQENPFEGGMAHSVAAALQTKGIIDQGQILSQITSLDMIAAFFYLVALALAVGSVAVFGNYRQGAYLLIGPVLYTFMVTVTTQSNGVKTKLGDFEVPNSVGRANEFLQHIKAIDNGGHADISLFYATFDGIVTEVFHTLIEFMLQSANIEHQKMLGRERALSFLLAGVPDEYTSVTRFITRHHIECHEPMKAFYRGGKDRADSTVYRGREQGDAEKSIAEAREKFERSDITLGPKDRKIKRMLQGIVDPSINPDNTYKINCKVAWEYIGTILEEIASVHLEDRAIYGSEEQEAPGDGDTAREQEDAKDFISSSTGTAPEKALAAIMYKNVLESSTHSALENHIYSRVPYNSKDSRINYNDMVTAEARASYLSLRMFAGVIPYMQGILLYLLSIGFPFFAMLLVIPGRAMSFIGWCSLWAWVKSWDVGFAVVHVARDLLWDVFKDKVDMHESGLTWDDPGSVYSFLAKNDPFANQNTYHELIAFLTISVPFLTAHMFLGATNMFSMFRLNIDQTVGRYRTFQAQVGFRDVATSVDHKRNEMISGFSRQVIQAQDKQQGMQFTSSGAPATVAGANGNGIGPAGGHVPQGSFRQTITGMPIARQRENMWAASVASNQIFGRQGIDNAMLGLSGGMAGDLIQISNESYMNEMESSLHELEDLEQSVNQGVSMHGRRYHIDGGSLSSLFQYQTEAGSGERVLMLDTPVSPEIMQAYRDKTGTEERDWIKGIDEGAQISWREFIQQDIAELNEKNSNDKVRLAVPHIARMLPPLYEKVSDEAVALLPEHNSLRRRHESAAGDEDKQATWREYMIAMNHEVKSYAHNFGMAEARPADSTLQKVSGNLTSKFIKAIELDVTSRIGVVGSENDRSMFTATVGGIYHLFGLGNELLRPGADGKPDGSGGNTHNINPGSPGGDSDGE
jgi:hypothetical protein